ncbi:hypothetical protein [Serratia nevei]|uniref:hypothetical protein n=1 Tax=Serratia nevei TaxID=2703794 RepID=UPI003AF6DB4E
MTLTIEELKYGAEVGDLGIDAVRAVCAEALANREAQPVPMGKFAGWGLYHTKSGEFGNWLKSTPESDNSHAISQGYANVKLYTAPPAPAVQDEIDSFADQVIGTKDKIIRLPAPMPVPLEGIRVYLNADTIISYLEKQGYIVEVSRE